MLAQELDYYRKQFKLQEIGKTGQERLKNAKVLVVGAGGLGCPSLLYLAGAGIGRITILDHDHVEISNLHRQPLYTYQDIGKSKAFTAAKRLKELNPFIEVEALAKRLGRKDLDLVKSHDVILDCSDNFATKFLTHDFCHLSKKALVQASIYKFEFQLNLYDFKNREAPCLRCLWPNRPEANIKDCNEAGVLGFLPGAAGAMQAAEALKFLLGQESLKQGETFLFDMRALEAQKIKWKQSAFCPLCSRERLKAHELPSLSENPLEYDYDQTDGGVLVDIREINEVKERPALPKAFVLPLSKGIQRHLQFARGQCKERKIIFYCAKGARSLKLVKELRKLGLTSCYSLAQGVEGAKGA